MSAVTIPGGSILLLPQDINQLESVLDNMPYQYAKQFIAYLNGITERQNADIARAKQEAEQAEKERMQQESDTSNGVPPEENIAHFEEV